MKNTIKRKAAIVIAAIVLIALFTSSGFYRIGQGEQGLVLTFGKVTHTSEPGLYWHIPLVQQVIAKSVTTIHNVEYGYRTSKGGTTRHAAEYTDMMSESVMLTNDNSIIQIEAIYQYTIKDVKQYVFDVDDAEGTMHLAFEAILRRNIQNRSLDDALLNKDDIEREVLPDFQNLIDSYLMGVKIQGVHIQNITVPKEVIAFYEDVNNAKNEKTRRIDEAARYSNQVLPLARSQAYKMTQDAHAYAASAVADAQAETATFNAVYDQYAANPDVAKKQMLIAAMEKVLGQTGRIVLVDSAGNGLQMLDLSTVLQGKEEVKP